MKVLSIDIGVKNFAMCIENFNQDIVNNFSKEYKQKFKKPTSRVNDNNEPNTDYEDFLKRLLNESSKTELVSKIDFSEDQKTSKTKNNQIILNNGIFYNIIQKLNEYEKSFEDVDYIVIEKQLKTNPNAQTIEHHVHAYFINKYGLSKEVINFESRHKTRVLCCPKKITKDGVLKKIDKPYRKKWTTNKIMNTMLERKDKETFDYIFAKNKSKADDLSDTICQAVAFIILRFIE
jgi:hypothetical protein